jgi:uncharacterized protein
MLSRYTKIYPCRDGSKGSLLYSTKKGSVVKASPELLNAIEEDTVPPGDHATLTRLEILTPDPAADRLAMARLVHQTNARCETFFATVVLTLDCNLACPYCFEDHFRGNHVMSAATARLLEEKIREEQMGWGRDVVLRFYGGEPLMALPRLKEIAGHLSAAAAIVGTNFSFSLVTNATLLTRSVVEELLPLGLTSAQVTLDGPGEIHDRQRPFVSGQGSFDLIVANLRDVCDLITLKPGGNFTRENYRRFPEMLDALLAAGIQPDRLGPVQFAPILPKSGVRSSCLFCGEEWFTEAALFLREETLRRGFAVEKANMGICMVEMANNLVVNYDGTLYKCPVFMGWPEMAVGTLADGVRDYSATHKLDLWHNDECLECAYLPLCFGGCRLLPLLNNGVIDRVDCRREFYDRALERIILQDIRYRPSPSIQTPSSVYP